MDETVNRLHENGFVKFWKSWGLFLLFGIFFAARFYRLGYHDLWYDEVGTVAYAAAPWKNWNAPFYWIFMHFWVKLFGLSEFSLRFPSLLCSFFSVLLTYLLGKNLFNKKVGVVASLLIGLSPFHLWYAQEARDYSMVLFFGTAASYALFRAVKEEKFVFWLFFILAAVGGFYTNYFYIFLFLAQILVLLGVKRFKIGFKETVYFLAVVACFLPYLPRFLYKFYRVWNGFWVLEPTGRSLIITLENFVMGYHGSDSLYRAAVFLAAVFFASAFWAARVEASRRSFMFCAGLLFIPIIAIYCFSRTLFSIYLDRGLLLFSPYAYLILSFGIGSLRRNVRAFFLSLLILLLLIGDYRFANDRMVEPIMHHLGSYTKKPVRPAVKYLWDNIKPEDEIAGFTNASALPGALFYGKVPDYYFVIDPVIQDTTWKRSRLIEGTTVSCSNMLRLKFKRLWIIASDWARSGGLDENSISVKAWLDKNPHLKLEFTKEIDGLQISRYARDGS